MDLVLCLFSLWKYQLRMYIFYIVWYEILFVKLLINESTSA